MSRRTALMVSAVAFVLGVGARPPAGPPSAADVQNFETCLIIGPYVTHGRDGRAYAEFAPNVQTRNVACVETERAGVYRCSLERRVTGWSAQPSETWEAQTLS